jgi:3-hydroxyacyl-[acyl-carrier-protein] dehydratase
LELIEINEIMRHLPHRYPFLLIDRILEWESGTYLKGIKNVTINEPFFQGHFPGRPVMPGVLILEALAQATGVLAFKTRQQQPDRDALYLFVSIDKARFKRQVEPGDQVELEVRLLRRLRNMWKFQAVARVGEEVAATAELMCAESRIER